jgi:hypothetical protein
VRVWPDTDVIRLLVDGARVKSISSHLGANDIPGPVAQGAVPAGPPSLPGGSGSTLDVGQLR